MAALLTSFYISLIARQPIFYSHILANLLKVHRIISLEKYCQTADNLANVP